MRPTVEEVGDGVPASRPHYTPEKTR